MTTDTYGEIGEVDVREVHGADGCGALAPVNAEVAAETPFPLLGFLGLTPKSARVTSILRARPTESKGRKWFCVDTGGLTRHALHGRRRGVHACNWAS